MYIYKITNIINNKVYIGQTIRPVEQRFRRHINDSINNVLDTHFARAIRKYGEENFKIEIIDKASTQEELNQLEQFWILKYDSVQNGYNETFAISKHGGDTYQNKSEDELWSIGEKIRDTKIGKFNPNATKVKCKNVFTQEEIHFDTQEECRLYFKASNHQFISRRCLKRLRNLYNGQWMIAYENDEYGQYRDPNEKKKTRRNIIVKDLDTGEEKQFSSYAKAEREYGLNKKELTKEMHLVGEIFTIRNKYEITVID